MQLKPICIIYAAIADPDFSDLQIGLDDRQRFKGRQVRLVELVRVEAEEVDAWILDQASNLAEIDLIVSTAHPYDPSSIGGRRGSPTPTAPNTFGITYTDGEQETLRIRGKINVPSDQAPPENIREQLPNVTFTSQPISTLVDAWQTVPDELFHEIRAYSAIIVPGIDSPQFELFRLGYIAGKGAPAQPAPSKEEEIADILRRTEEQRSTRSDEIEAFINKEPSFAGEEIEKSWKADRLKAFNENRVKEIRTAWDNYGPRRSLIEAIVWGKKTTSEAVFNLFRAGWEAKEESDRKTWKSPTP